MKPKSGVKRKKPSFSNPNVKEVNENIFGNSTSLADKIIASSGPANKFDHNFEHQENSKINENLPEKEEDSESEDSKDNFEEESKRFNNDYFQMFAQERSAHNHSKSKDDNEYDPDFEEIEEEILCNEAQDTDKYSDTFSQGSHKSKRRTNGFGGNKYPKELEENPYLYYAKKAQMRMKAKASGRKTLKKSTMNSIGDTEQS